MPSIQIKEIDKKANVVIVTGFSEFDSKNKDVIKQRLIKIISKPLGVNELLALAKKYNQIKAWKRIQQHYQISKSISKLERV